MNEPRILLVDDEQSVLNALQRFFRRSGFEVTTCNSAKDALELLENSEPYHLVISDYRMPQMNGVEFLSAVRLRWPETVRIVLSGYADSSAIIAATNEGNIYKFIPKPWDEEFLLTSVQEALSIHSRNQELNRQLDALGDALANLDTLQSISLSNQTQIFQVYQTLLDQMPVGLVGLDRENDIVSMNKKAQELLGLSVAPLGEQCCRVLPGLCGVDNSISPGAVESTILSVNNSEIKVLAKKLHEGEMVGIMLILVLTVKEREP